VLVSLKASKKPKSIMIPQIVSVTRSIPFKLTLAQKEVSRSTLHSTLPLRGYIGHPTLANMAFLTETRERLNRLDDLFRCQMRASEAERKVHDDYDLANNLAMLAALKTPDEPASRSGQIPKSRKGQRPAPDSDTTIESPGPSPSDARVDMLKRVKGAAQRSSSVVSQGRSSTAPRDDGIEMHRGVLAERAGELATGIEVFYRFKPNSSEEGAGIQGVIKKVWKEKKP